MVTTPCAPGLKWWVEGENYCRVTANCEIEKNGISCVQTGCELLDNLLPNPSFEESESEKLAVGWKGNSTYFNKASGSLDRIYAGKSSIWFYSAGGNITENFKSDPAVDLPNGGYTFKGFVYNYLNVGEIEVSIIDTKDNVLGSKKSSSKYGWEAISFDFTVLDIDVLVKVEVSGDQVSGTARFDNFRISENCLVQPVTLTMVPCPELVLLQFPFASSIIYQ